jgi:hypothetical protein
MPNDNRKKGNKAARRAPVARVSISVAVADAYLTPDKFAALVKQLDAAGMRVQEQLITLGVIAGDAPANALEALKALPGVVAVEQMRSFQLPPDDEPS